MNLFEELKRRNVLRVALVYVVVAWLSVQVGDIMFESFGTPDWVMKTFIGFLGLGFPIAVIFAWAFEITPEGIKKEKDVDRSQSITHETGKKLNYWVIGAMAVAIVYLAVDNYILDDGGSATEQVADATDDVYSIAVLPFVNMSNDPDNEYFSDGLSEELLNVLAKIEDFRVAGRTSSFSFKGKDTDFQAIGEKLKVETILEGSVRKAGDQVRITAQLVNVEDGYHLWSETYDRDLDNIFEVQDEIATAVVSALKQTLLGEEDLAVIDRKSTDNVDAYAHYLRGKFHIRGRQKDDLQKAQDEFQLAITLDPEFALAYAGLAEAYAHQGVYGFRVYGEVQPLAQAALDRARSIDDGLAEVWSSQALLYYYNAFRGFSPDKKLALEQAEQAVRLNPNDGESWLRLAISRPASQLRETVKAGEEAYNRDPLHPVILHSLVGSYLLAGEHDKARSVAQELIDVNPDFYRGYEAMSDAHWQQGRWDEAIRWYKKAFERSPEHVGIPTFTSVYYRELGDLESAEVWAEQAVANGPTSPLATWGLAVIRYESGNTQQALALLNENLEQNPDDNFARGNTAYMELVAGNYARALELYEKVMTPDAGAESWRITDSNLFSAANYAFLLRETGNQDESRAVTEELLRTMDALEAGGRREFYTHVNRGQAHAVRQDNQRAIASFRAAHEQGWPGETWLDYEPLFEQLRQDIGFVALLDEMRTERQKQIESLRAEGI